MILVAKSDDSPNLPWCPPAKHSHYTVCKDTWSSLIGEHLICEREMLNSTDRYVCEFPKIFKNFYVAVLKNDIIIGYLPRVI